MSQQLQTVSPIDGSIYVERDYASSASIKRTITLAQATQKTWATTNLSIRQKICSAAVDAFINKKDEIATELSWQMGRPIRYGAGEVAGFEERARHMIAIADQGLEEVQIEEKDGFNRYIKRIPVGVCFIIAPWNYPYLTAINSIMPAILAGNSVVLKHSAQTPLCAERLAEAFKTAGLPEGVFQYLHLNHRDTEALVAAPEINFVAFTGSVPGGVMVEKAAAGQFKATGLELGGKDPAFVRHDADINYAVETTIDGAFFNSGQSCCGIERLYVHESVFDEFVEKAVALVKNYKLGRPDDPDTTLGPMVKTSAADFVRGQISEAIASGAKSHIDENLFPMSKAGTPYLAPQVLTDVDHSMRIMTEESFGPVVGIQKVKSDEEAITLMNDSEFGLTAAIFTKDIEAGTKIGDQIDTGTLFINRCDYLDPSLAWTGIKNSGRGCTLSILGFDALTRPKSYHLKTTD